MIGFKYKVDFAMLPYRGKDKFYSEELLKCIDICMGIGARGKCTWSQTDTGFSFHFIEEEHYILFKLAT